MNKSAWKLGLSLIVSLSIIFLIYRKIDFGFMLQVWQNIAWKPFIVFISLLVIQVIIASFRWQQIISGVGQVAITWKEAYHLVSGSYSANLVIPGKMGELVRVFWMKSHGLKTGTLSLVLLEKYFDVLSVIIWLWAGLSLVWVAHDGPVAMNDTGLWFITGILVVCALGLRPLLNWVVKRPAAIVQHSWILKWREKTEQLANGLKRASLGRLLIISTGLWCVQILQFYFLFQLFGIAVPLPHLFVGCAMALLAGALPISIGGIGPRDAVLYWYFAPFAAKEIIVTIGLLSVLRIILPALAGLPSFFVKTKGV